MLQDKSASKSFRHQSMNSVMRQSFVVYRPLSFFFTSNSNSDSHKSQIVRNEVAIGLLWSRVSKKTRKRRSRIRHNNRTTMEEFSVGSWFAGLRYPTRSSSEAERQSSAPHVRGIGPQRDEH